MSDDILKKRAGTAVLEAYKKDLATAIALCHRLSRRLLNRHRDDSGYEIDQQLDELGCNPENRWGWAVGDFFRYPDGSTGLLVSVSHDRVVALKEHADSIQLDEWLSQEVPAIEQFKNEAERI